MDNTIKIKESVFQKDGRVRLPKSVVQEMGLIPGQSYFDIKINIDKGTITLNKSESKKVNNYGKK